MSNLTVAGRKRCTPRDSGGEAAATPKIRPSRAGKIRATVLAIVQLVMILHVIHWVVRGRTLTPVEPSETIQTVSHGVINAGAIFFAVALAATLVLGRWFCGWGCHLVMLQDLCGWIMRKMGVRPRQFRSRFLVYVPLAMAAKMFLWPLFYRFVLIPLGGGSPDWPGFEVELTTTHFWQTFAGVAVAIPFLLICGFATVYFLGAKGFCTYGCPYGGFFSPLDRLSPARIRVTSACEQCGHCTAVCSSNVRVHEEVREYGMVVDPGCMKCLDCVSVCPNDALYFGFGRPALAKGKARFQKPRKTYDLTLPEEFAFSGLFLGSFLSVFLVYTMVPFLMAAGWSGVVTFLAWKLRRLRKDSQVTLHHWRLKERGRLTGAGKVWAGVAVLGLLLTLHCGIVNGLYAAARHYDLQVPVPANLLDLARAPGLAAESQRARTRAVKLYALTQPLTAGGLGLLPNDSVDYHLARLYAAAGEFPEAEACLDRLLVRAPAFPYEVDLARILVLQGKEEQAARLFEDSLARDPEAFTQHKELADWYLQHGRAEDAERVLRQGILLQPERAELRYQLGVLLCRSGSMEEGIALLEDVTHRPRKAVEAMSQLAQVLERLGRLEEAESYARRAVEAQPEDVALRRQWAHLLERLGRPAEAEAALRPTQ